MGLAHYRASLNLPNATILRAPCRLKAGLHTHEKEFRKQSGILLMDCLMYMGLLFLVASMAYVVFYRGWDNSMNLRRGAEQIEAALTAGERWREDVRTATAPAHFEAVNGDPVLLFPHGKDTVGYRTSSDSVWRRANDGAPWIEILNRVKSSRMELEPRQSLTAWRWELEFKTRQPKRKLQPVFTFEAVPPQSRPARDVTETG